MMKRRFSRVSGIVLFVLFAFFFASTNLCIHTHEGPHGKIVHSHPWSGKSHNHSSSQFQLISLLSATAYSAPSTVDHIEPPCAQTIILEFRESDKALSSFKPGAYYVRGSPAFI